MAEAREYTMRILIDWVLQHADVPESVKKQIKGFAPVMLEAARASSDYVRRQLKEFSLLHDELKREAITSAEYKKKLQELTGAIANETDEIIRSERATIDFGASVRDVPKELKEGSAAFKEAQREALRASEALGPYTTEIVRISNLQTTFSEKLNELRKAIGIANEELIEQAARLAGVDLGKYAKETEQFYRSSVKLADVLSQQNRIQANLRATTSITSEETRDFNKLASELIKLLREQNKEFSTWNIGTKVEEEALRRLGPLEGKLIRGRKEIGGKWIPVIDKSEIDEVADSLAYYLKQLESWGIPPEPERIGEWLETLKVWKKYTAELARKGLFPSEEERMAVFKGLRERIPPELPEIPGPKIVRAPGGRRLEYYPPTKYFPGKVVPFVPELIGPSAIETINEAIERIKAFSSLLHGTARKIVEETSPRQLEQNVNRTAESIEQLEPAFSETARSISEEARKIYETLYAPAVTAAGGKPVAIEQLYETWRKNSELFKELKWPTVTFEEQLRESAEFWQRYRPSVFEKFFERNTKAWEDWVNTVTRIQSKAKFTEKPWSAFLTLWQKAEPKRLWEWQEAYEGLQRSMLKVKTWRERRQVFEEYWVKRGMPLREIREITEKTYFPGEKKGLLAGFAKQFKESTSGAGRLGAVLGTTKLLFDKVAQSSSETAESLSAQQASSKKVADAASDLTSKEKEFIKTQLENYKALSARVDKFAQWISANRKALGVEELHEETIREIAEILATRLTREEEKQIRTLDKYGSRFRRAGQQIGFFGWVTIYTARFATNTLQDLWNMLNNVMKVGADWTNNLKTIGVTLGLLRRAGLEQTTMYGFLQGAMKEIAETGLDMQTAYMAVQSTLIVIQSIVASRLVPAFLALAESIAKITETEVFQETLNALVVLIESDLVPAILGVVAAFIEFAPALLQTARYILVMIGVLSKMSPLLFAVGLAAWALGPALQTLGFIMQVTNQLLQKLTVGAALTGVQFNILGKQVTLSAMQCTIAASIIKTAIVTLISVIAIFGIMATVELLNATNKMNDIWKSSLEYMKKSTTTGLKKVQAAWSSGQYGTLLISKKTAAQIREVFAKMYPDYVQTTTGALLLSKSAWIEHMQVIKDAQGNILFYIDTLTGAVYDSTLNQVGWWNQATGAIVSLSEEQIGVLDSLTGKYVSAQGDISGALSGLDYSIDSLEKDFSDFSTRLERFVGNIDDLRNHLDILNFVMKAMSEVTLVQLSLALAQIHPVLGAVAFVVGSLIIWFDELRKAIEALGKALWDWLHPPLVKVQAAFGALGATLAPLGTSLFSLSGPINAVSGALSGIASAGKVVVDAFSGVSAIGKTVADAFSGVSSAGKTLTDTLGGIAKALGSLCFIHVAGYVETFNNNLTEANRTMEETLSNLGAMRSELSSIPGHGGMPTLGAPGTPGTTGEIVQHITVYATVHIGSVTGVADLDYVTEAVNKGIAEALRRRLP